VPEPAQQRREAVDGAGFAATFEASFAATFEASFAATERLKQPIARNLQ
jgi:hypothetical protein